jgi:hypothetical protein
MQNSTRTSNTVAFATVLSSHFFNNMLHRNMHYFDEQCDKQ